MYNLSKPETILLHKEYAKKKMVDTSSEPAVTESVRSGEVNDS